MENMRSREFLLGELFARNGRAMRSEEFEQFLREVFLALGYEVAMTKVTGDQGIDLIVSRDGMRIAVQVNGYFSSVGNEAV